MAMRFGLCGCLLVACAQAAEPQTDQSVAATEKAFREAFSGADVRKLDAIAAYPVRNREYAKDGKLDNPAELKRAFRKYLGVLQKDIPADQEWSLQCLANATIQATATPGRYRAFCAPLEFSFKKIGPALKLIRIDNVNE